MQNIFVYGTLQSPELMLKLTGQTFQSHPAVLKGYKRCCIRDADYPAIIETENDTTEGLLYENVDIKSLKLLLLYEGNEYKREKVTVLCDKRPKEAIAFVWADDINLLRNKNWDFTHFEKNHLQDYLDFVVPATLIEFDKK